MKPLQDGRVSVASLTIRHSLSWLWPSVVQTFRQIFQNWNKLQKEREHRVYSAEQGRHITVQCHAVTCPSKEWWQTDFTCKDVCLWMATPSCSVGAGTELLPALVCSWPHSQALTIRQPAELLPLSQCEAVGPHGSMLQSYSVTCWCSHFGKAL